MPIAQPIDFQEFLGSTFGLVSDSLHQRYSRRNWRCCFIN